MYKHKIVNTITGEEIIEDLSDKEIAEIEQNIVKTEKIFLEQKTIEEEVKVKRQALLNKLGITEDEAQLLLGGN